MSNWALTFHINGHLLLLLIGRLDQILGRQGSKAKDVYDSKQSLASRIVKTERQARLNKSLL